MRILITLVSILLMSACISYDGTTRLMIEGRITDRDGNPIEGMGLSVRAQKAGFFIPFVFFIPDARNTINQMKTDSEGRFRMLFPRPIDADDIVLLINEQNDGSIPTFNQRSIFNIQPDDFRDYTIDFGSLEMFNVNETTFLTIDIQPEIPGRFRGIRLRLDALRQLQQDDYGRNLSDEIYTAFSGEIAVARNQVAAFYYDVLDRDSSLVSSNVRLITIGESPLTYEIRY